MLKITIFFILFFFLISFLAWMLNKFGNSKLFYIILGKILGLLLLTVFSITGIVYLF